MGVADNSDIRCEWLQSMADSSAVLTSSHFDELHEPWERLRLHWQGQAKLTVLFPTPVGPITLT